MDKVSDDATVSGVDFNELDSICVAESLKMSLDKRMSELRSAKPVQIFAPELIAFLELQVFNRNL